MDKSKYSDTVQMWMNFVREKCYSDTELTLKYCEQIIEYGNQIEDDSLIGYGYYHKCVVYYEINDGNSFYEAMTNALSHLNKVEEWMLMARCYNYLGIFTISRGNVTVALDYYENAINCAKKLDTDEFTSVVHINIGVLNIFSGRYAEALESLEIAYDYFSMHPELSNYDDYMVCVYENMAKAYLLKGDLIESKCCFERIFSEHKEYCDEISFITVLCTEAIYYHIADDDAKCEKSIALIDKKISSSMPVMDMFNDYYDYCKMLIERDKQEEFWHVMSIMEPMVKSLGIVNLHRRLVGLKLIFYRNHNQTEEYYKEAGEFFELSELIAVENTTMMNHVLNMRRNLEKANIEKQEIEAKNELLKAKSETDALTGLSNRFRLNDYSEEIFKRALKNRTSLAVEILDMDCFKGYNDNYGHQRGDECIQKIASAIKSMEEFGAFAARYGGDEFILIYEDITKDQAVAYAAELRKRVMDLGIENIQSKVASVMTISQGICWDIPVEGNRMWDYMHAADDMLYRIKKKKRNNFCVGNLTKDSSQLVMSYL